ncbi:MAG: sugar phosphate isomerase/epimerase [Bacteroidota bacterium]|nr:sugar phosphate isomerase/epimerase [Bacteroidota bacterium]
MLNRRTFIRQSSVFAAALMVDTKGLFKMHKDLGLQLYTIRDEIAKTKDLSATIGQVASAGYRTLELYGYNSADRTFFGKSVKEFSAILKKHGLATPSGHYGIADMTYGADYNWDSWKRLLEDAHTLGHKYVVIPYMDDKHRTPDDFKRIAERLNKGGELSKSAGLITGYHNHNFEFEPMDGATVYDYLLKNTDPNLVKFEMDIYWVVYAGQDPATWFNKYPGRFAMWHIKDMEKETQGKPKGQTCEVGNGVIDWKSIFKHQARAGVDYVFVEQEQYRHPVFDCIKTSAAYMKKNLLK